MEWTFAVLTPGDVFELSGRLDCGVRASGYDRTALTFRSARRRGGLQAIYAGTGACGGHAPVR